MLAVLNVLHVWGRKKSAHAMQKHTAFQKMPEPTGTGRGTDNRKVTGNLQKYSNGGSFLGVRLNGLQPLGLISQKDRMTFPVQSRKCLLVVGRQGEADKIFKCIAVQF